MNNRMIEQVSRGDAIDVSECPHTPEGDYVLQRYVDGVDYCDVLTGVWIGSIGRRLSDGAILASTTSKFHGDPDFECLWLR